MIDLGSATQFAQGGNRKCFIHPQDSSKCIKVINQESYSNRLKNLPWHKKIRGKISFNDNHEEAKGYQQKSLKNIDQSSWKHLAKYFGFIKTNMGEGLVTELIKNEGEIAGTLEDYLFKFGLTEEIKESIHVFEKWLLDNLILTKNIIPHNLVIKKDSNELVIKIIDGIGSKAFIPFPEYFNFFAKRYVKRRIELMWSRINWDLSGRKGDWK